MHPTTKEAFEQIDAGVFSGDEFYTKEGIEILEKYIGRWRRELPQIKRVVKEMEAEEDPKTGTPYLPFTTLRKS